METVAENRTQHEPVQRDSHDLAQALAMTRAMLDAATDGILVTDSEGRMTACNERFIEIWAIPASELVVAHWRQLLEHFVLQLRDPAAFIARAKEIQAQDSLVARDLLELSDGRQIECHTRPQRVGGHTVGRVWIYRDITQQRQAEEALREEAQVLDLLNRTGHALTSKLSLRDLMQAVTDAGRQITGAQVGAFFHELRDSNEQVPLYQLCTLSGRWGIAYEQDGQPPPAWLFKPVLDAEGVVRISDLSMDPRYRQGLSARAATEPSMQVRSYVAAPVLSRAGTPCGALMFGHDQPAFFSERSERLVLGLAGQASVALDNAHLYEAAQRHAHDRGEMLQDERAARVTAERGKALTEELLRSLAQELREPFTEIVEALESLRRGDSESQARPTLDLAASRVRSLMDLMDELVDISLLAAGKARLDTQLVEPANLLADAIQDCLRDAQARSLRIVREGDSRTRMLRADPLRLRRAMKHALRCTFHAAPQGTQLRISLHGHEVHVHADDGGLRFDRLPSLSLCIARSLVELHGGDITVGDAAGEGASFLRIRLADAITAPEELNRR